MTQLIVDPNAPVLLTESDKKEVRFQKIVIENESATREIKILRKHLKARNERIDKQVIEIASLRDSIARKDREIDKLEEESDELSNEVEELMQREDSEEANILIALAEAYIRSGNEHQKQEFIQRVSNYQFKNLPLNYIL